MIVFNSQSSFNNNSFNINEEKVHLKNNESRLGIFEEKNSKVFIGK